MANQTNVSAPLAGDRKRRLASEVYAAVQLDANSLEKLVLTMPGWNAAAARPLA